MPSQCLGATNPAVIGAVSALAGVVVAKLFDLLAESRADRRWFADHFLNDKLDSMRQAYSALTIIDRMLHPLGGIVITDPLQARDTVGQADRDLAVALMRTSLYLNERDQGTLVNVMRLYRNKIGSLIKGLPPESWPQGRGIFEHAPDQPPDEKEIEAAFYGALAMLRQHLYPTSVSQLEQRLRDKNRG